MDILVIKRSNLIKKKYFQLNPSDKISYQIFNYVWDNKSVLYLFFFLKWQIFQMWKILYCDLYLLICSMFIVICICWCDLYLLLSSVFVLVVCICCCDLYLLLWSVFTKNTDHNSKHRSQKQIQITTTNTDHNNKYRLQHT
jgi:hypothetical protein